MTDTATQQTNTTQDTPSGHSGHSFGSRGQVVQSRIPHANLSAWHVLLELN